MNKDDLIKKLEHIDLPEIELQSHKRRLKMALLARHSFSEGRLNSGYFKKQTTMSLLKRFAPFGAVAVIALFVVVGVNYFKSSSSVSNLSLAPAVYAKDLVGKAEEQLTKTRAIAGYVEPTTDIMQWKEPDADGNIRDEKGNIIFVTDKDGKLAPAPYELPDQDKHWGNKISRTFTRESFLNSLEEAKQAKDLTYLGDKVLDNGKKIKILQFTDAQGNTTILGVDENNLPAVRIMHDGNGNSGSGGGVIFQQGEIKDGNRPVPSGEGIRYWKTDPNAQLGLENQLKYWTENLEQSTDFKAIQK